MTIYPPFGQITKMPLNFKDIAYHPICQFKPQHSLVLPKTHFLFSNNFLYRIILFIITFYNFHFSFIFSTICFCLLNINFCKHGQVMWNKPCKSGCLQLYLFVENYDVLPNKDISVIPFCTLAFVYD